MRAGLPPAQAAAREQVRDAGHDAALVFCADKISKVRELPDHIRRDRARFDTATARDSRAANRMRYALRRSAPLTQAQFKALRRQAEHGINPLRQC